MNDFRNPGCAKQKELGRDRQTHKSGNKSSCEDVRSNEKLLDFLLPECNNSQTAVGWDGRGRPGVVLSGP